MLNRWNCTFTQLLPLQKVLRVLKGIPHCCQLSSSSGIVVGGTSQGWPWLVLAHQKDDMTSQHGLQHQGFGIDIKLPWAQLALVFMQGPDTGEAHGSYFEASTSAWS